MSAALAVLEPATEQVLETVPAPASPRADAAVAAARPPSPPGGRSPPPTARAVRGLVDPLETPTEELAAWRPQRGQADRRGARRDRRAIETFRYSRRARAPARRHDPRAGGMVFTSASRSASSALITPWNFPLGSPVEDGAPLAAGNTVVLKPRS